MKDREHQQIQRALSLDQFNQVMCRYARPLHTFATQVRAVTPSLHLVIVRCLWHSEAAYCYGAYESISKALVLLDCPGDFVVCYDDRRALGRCLAYGGWILQTATS